ncbi:hypothetical protein F1D05_29115 [Kribbella qitaiheensis]|uniref:PknH-like extracellular domain-containing protein n=1 Tax=Kribbella qitaiheensis TaxID=1544730 RepID=A0A7G6X4R1_9ACTN|nr:hypothetical protein [Kribbella qitaiheensis]QNE21226.1 hypothetical protein F1D05_29115 [Kribbella qitaiheensis]
MKPVLAVVAALGLLVGCSNSAASGETPPPTTPIPSTVGGTVPVPTNTLSTAKPTDAAKPPQIPERATAPPPASAGPVTAKNLPAPEKLGDGWKTYTDPGGSEQGFLGNDTWTRRRDGHQAAYEALPVGCANPQPKGSLPVPLHALQGSYRTGSDQPANALLLRFADATKATAYFTGYQARMKGCGDSGGLAVQSLWSTDTTAAAVRRYAEADAFVEVSVVRGSTVALLAQQSSNPETEGNWSHSVASELETVIDLP